VTTSAAEFLARAALPVLQRLPPETAHTLGLRGLRLLQGRWPVRLAHPSLAVEAFGLRFAHPLGLAAGFDKNGEYLDALGALGFSHIEIGTVTPRPQPGNPRPRLFRLPQIDTLLNRMGFNNKGADYVAARLQESSYRGIRGVSIGKNADTPLERATDDYLECLRKLYPQADYFAINVSSPNTQRLRELQAPEALSDIIVPLQQERASLAKAHGKRVPLLVKISPDLDGAMLRELCATLKRHGVDGVIATNTTVGSQTLRALAKDLGAGGFSGMPLAPRATGILQELRRELGDAFPIIATGGIMDREAALARLQAGANLVQVYTGFVYRGPALVTEILDALAPVAD
jgi:dihydroorotate dehydrogenase